MTTTLPEAFLAAMQDCLGEDYEAFLAGSTRDRLRALRINPMKITSDRLSGILGTSLKEVPWVRDGFFYPDDLQPARHPAYAAGLYYLQEPSAMTPASRLSVRPGDRVLDLCAAPGGKATALGAALAGKGLLVANDINLARARALVRNIELFGIRNAFVTNEAPYLLIRHFPEFFDRIMVDAPCSGEGMFRKNPAAIDAWLEKGPGWFSRLQKEIILHAADMLKPGGQMLYSTCTFSPEENEAVITHLLAQRPQMEVVPMEDYEGFGPGLSSFRDQVYDDSCRLCRRIWPHRMPGEGHFLALLRKKGTCLREAEAPARRKKGRQSGQKADWWLSLKSLSKEQKDSLADFFSGTDFAPDPLRLDLHGDKLYYVPAEIPRSMKIHFLRNGLFLGTLKKKRFEPSQPFALSLGPGRYPYTMDLAADDDRCIRYLRGEDLPVDSDRDLSRHQPGRWYLVTLCGHPLGFGKLTKEVMKNKYPPGWRTS